MGLLDLYPQIMQAAMSGQPFPGLTDNGTHMHSLDDSECHVLDDGNPDMSCTM